ncbi:hypothetical protein E4U09_001121 [Claviceps aff. purpurea]|uniref:WSC domain-containing protein n=1 Tax=Claviceps aff. purpurea TaxID=1967640 RepID=A0A9P7U3S1_9HYPO|nr:hypothetical protein E4U12_004789 [Claviceps purpurea]KAG6195449.1 hypothetical protein E4U10_001876 [Claviceps purpurea]KAG6207496.1 hypothetical protein E4U34_008036 [Claviceps purpurea]KAG6297973.1 hypothetical protein E4U09_001121 [Claviceps aff. purpurea]
MKLAFTKAMMAAPGIGSILLMAAAWSGLTDAIDVDICASFNTASMGRNVSIFQTNGLCHDYCNPDSYAYAITQYNSCWCSNYTPDKSTQLSTGKCNLGCPGYPDEKCGGTGLFGYVVLPGGLPSGTKGASIAPSSTESSPTSTEVETTTPTAPTTSTTIMRSSSVETVVVADGTIKTVTVVPTGTGSQSPSVNQGATVEESGLKTGAVVGIVVGVVGGVLILAAVTIFFYFRHKKQQQQNGYQDDPSIRGSSSGMMGSGRAEMSRAPTSPGSTGNRSSLLPVDPRMDPFQQSLYVRSGSRESVGTLRDDHDYSRRIQQPKVLRATNPDPVVS